MLGMHLLNATDCLFSLQVHSHIHIRHRVKKYLYIVERNSGVHK